jgi:crotonobetaine/carnitine-CoA ligase
VIPPTAALGEPWLQQDVRWLLDQQALAHGGAEALVWRPHDAPRRAWTYTELVAGVDRLAAGLARWGIGEGDVVGIHADNCPEFLFTWLAAHTLGASIVTTNTRSSPDELRYYLDRSGAAVVVTQAPLAPVVETAVRGSGPGPLKVLVDSEPRAGWVPFEDLPHDGAVPRGEIDPARRAGVQFTSGTTARPKGVVWTQANYLWGGMVSARHEGLTPDDRHLTHLPLFHTNAQSYSVMASWWAGGTVILLPGFSARRFWPVAVEERATWSAMIPFTVKALRDQPVPPDHSFRCWGNGISVPAWERRTGIPTLTWWGMTETVSHPIVSVPGEPVRPLAMGRPAPEYEVRIVDDDGRLIEGAGQGLLEVAGVPGVSLMAGYLDDPEATAAAYTADGWLTTGDRVERYDDGWFGFLERDKDMLKVGGENVAALEIERVIARVSGVDEVAVVAGRDPMLDEVPVAFVVAAVPAAGLAAEIESACRAQLADFKVPRLVAIVEDLPRSTLAKVAKSELRARASALVADARRPDTGPGPAGGRAAAAGRDA